MTEPIEVDALVAQLRKKYTFFKSVSHDTENETMILLRSSADALTAVSAERDRFADARVGTGEDADRYMADRDRLHKAITEALAEHDRQVAERAWNEGRDNSPFFPTENPYREEQP